MDSIAENAGDEAEISSFDASNGNWSSQSASASNSTLLFIAVEYVKENSNGDYKFETESAFSPNPSTTYSEFDQHVSPLDPNMSSTARYSPVYSDSVDNPYNNSSVVVMQDAVNPLISSEIDQNSASLINPSPEQGGYHLATSPTSPLESISPPLLNTESNLLRQAVENRFLQMVEIEDSSTCPSPGSPGNLHIDYGQPSPSEVDEQILNKQLQLVQFPIANYQHQLSNLKVDPDQVELLITDQNTGISYSGYVSQDFLVSRSTLPTLTDEEQQLSNVLNNLESHGLVMEANEPGDINEVAPQSGPLTIPDGQMLLQDPLLDSDLLLQAPVEITLDDNVLSAASTLILKSGLAAANQILPANPLNTDIVANDGLNATNLELASQPLAQPQLQPPPSTEMMNKSFELINVKEEHLEYYEENIKSELDGDQLLRRSKRQNDRQIIEEDTLALNRVQSIIDKPVPSRARATLPGTYLVINKISVNPETEQPVYGVFARKAIPKRTQFGPFEGILLDAAMTEQLKQTPGAENNFKLLLESETGVMHHLDISDENTSNWMRFVRIAKTYNEQNLVLSQQGYSLYFTTTRAILPRQELLVGYSDLYAAKRKLTSLQPSTTTTTEAETTTATTAPTTTTTEDNLWPCFECSQKCATSEELQKHLNVHDDTKEGPSKSRVKKLARLKRRPVECPHCSRSFLRKQSLNRHMLQHTNPNAYRERQMRHIRRISVSSNVVDKILEWKCDICALYFPNPSLLNLHELVHKTDKSETITGLPLDLGSGCNEGEFLVHSGAVQCPQCGNEYATRKSLIEHVAEHGKKQSNDTEIIKKAYKCYMCYKAFASRDRLQRHMLVHGSEESKPLKCDVCSKRFLNNSALSCHLKIHKMDKKIFECPICKESFEQILLLKEHVRCHCVNGQYTCPHCNKIFKEYSLVRKHIRAFHCDRKHGCQYCGKPFPTLDKLRMHLLKHSDHREFLCSECGNQFKRKDKLKEHMKRMHSGDREARYVPPKLNKPNGNVKKFMPKVQPTDYHRFIYKCHNCLVGFKRRGMLVNHLAKRHPDISPDSVPELNLPIFKTTRDYYCQYCDKVYKSSSKRKAHILKNHPGAELPMSNRHKGGIPDIPGVPNPTFSQTVGSVTTNPHGCQWCHKQYASKAKLLQHQRKKHQELLPSMQKQSGAKSVPSPLSPGIPEDGKFMNSPDVPDSTVLSDDVQQVTDEQLNALVTEDFMHCEDSKVALTSNNIKQSFKLSDEALLSQAVIEELDECRSNSGQYYRLIQLSSGLSQHGDDDDDETVDDPPEPSRLYRLLTANTNAPFQPYPPR